ncbi:MAG: SDR family NAD(P)-dependent oxidoreductase [Albidovulum sp.]|nr:SDR family NAD(P)-dependent oxidoreductase [Albidovulum sp.]
MTSSFRKKILIIGGGAPPGSAIVGHLSGTGSLVAFNGGCQEQGLELAKATGATFIPGDWQPEDGVDRIVSDAVDALEGLDGLVWAGNSTHAARISETTDSAWDAVIEHNLVAPFRFAKAAMPLLSIGGGIVFVASGAAARTEMELGACSVAGRALLWLSNMLAVEGGPRGIAANAICVGEIDADARPFIDEPQLRDLGPAFVPPAGRLASPEDVARAVEFFLLRNNGTCTGTSLTVDGGLRSALRANKVHGA